MIPLVRGNVGKPVRLKGTAYDFDRTISAVQFSLDDGAHWTAYPTANTNDYQNVRWVFNFTPPQAGRYRMKVRAVNDRGEASPEAAYVELEID